MHILEILHRKFYLRVQGTMKKNYNLPSFVISTETLHTPHFTLYIIITRGDSLLIVFIEIQYLKLTLLIKNFGLTLAKQPAIRGDQDI